MGTRGCGWNRTGVSTTDQLARQTGRSTVRLARKRSAAPARRAANPGTGPWISRIGRPSFSASRQCDGAQRSAAVSA